MRLASALALDFTGEPEGYLAVEGKGRRLARALRVLRDDAPPEQVRPRPSHGPRMTEEARDERRAGVAQRGVVLQIGAHTHQPRLEFDRNQEVQQVGVVTVEAERPPQAGKSRG